MKSLVKGCINGIQKMGKKALNGAINHSPELALIGGIGLIITGTVVLVKKGSDIKDDLMEHDVAKELLEDELQDALEDIEHYEIDMIEEAEEDLKLTQKTYRKKLAKLYGKTALAVSKDLAIGVGIEAAGIGLILFSYGIMRKRTALLMTAYEGLAGSLNSYRQRVRDEIGTEKESDIWNGRKKVTVVEDVVDEETGKKKKVKREVLQNSGNQNVGWIFDKEHARNAEDSYIYNMDYCVRMQNYLNDHLVASGDGIMVGNDFADAFGFDRWAEGCVMGIRYGAETDEDGNPKKFDLGLWVEEKWNETKMCMDRIIHLNPNFDALPVWEHVGKAALTM